MANASYVRLTPSEASLAGFQPHFCFGPDNWVIIDSSKVFRDCKTAHVMSLREASLLDYLRGVLKQTPKLMKRTRARIERAIAGLEAIKYEEILGTCPKNAPAG